MMNSECWERVYDELECIKNTAEYGIDCENDEDELKEILADIKRSYGTITHILSKH